MASDKDNSQEDDVSVGFDFAPIGLAVSTDRTVIDCNKIFCEMFDYKKSDLLGKSLAMLYPSLQEYTDIGQHGIKVMQNSGKYIDERIMKRSNGELFWCRVRGQALVLERPFEKCVWSFADLSSLRPIVNLTPRERQVASLLVEGLSSKEIARSLELSHRTIEIHRSNLLKKYKVRNTVELVSCLSGMPI